MAFVAMLAEGLLALSQAFGGNIGLSIFTGSLLVRLALLPLSLSLARRARRLRLALESLRPELDALRERFAADPARLAEETLRLYRARGVRLMGPAQLLGALVQPSLVSGLYAAIRGGLTSGARFLWVTDLARPDALISIVCAALAFGTAALSPEMPRDRGHAMAWVSAALTLLFLWRTAAALGLGLYAAAGSAVGMLQGALIRRR
jgi:YidC/Oxa1 family membrane protein insertase